MLVNIYLLENAGKSLGIVSLHWQSSLLHHGSKFPYVVTTGWGHSASSPSPKDGDVLEKYYALSAADGVTLQKSAPLNV